MRMVNEYGHEIVTFSEQAALTAMQGLLANPSQMSCFEEIATKRSVTVMDVAACVAVGYAEALLSALKEQA